MKKSIFLLKTFFAISLTVIISTACSGNGSSGVSREPSEPLFEISQPRFTLSDGVYTNKKAQKTNRAILMFAGDLMMSYDQARDIAKGSYDYITSFDRVSGIFAQSDFAAANLETLISHSAPYRWDVNNIDTPQGKMPNCNSSPTFLGAVKRAGFDAVVTANNHCLDAGFQGIFETIDNLERYKLLHTGTFKDKDDDRFIIIDVNGIKIALLSYGTGTLNSMVDLYTDEQMAPHINRYEEDAVERDIAAAKARGAEYIIVFMHWGGQNSTELNSSRLKRALQIAEAGADYIAGAHPHVINPYDIITTSDGREVPCMYSMGNFLSGMDEVKGHLNRDSLILRIELEKSDGGVTLAEDSYIPCYIRTKHKEDKYVIVPCGEEYGGIDTKGTATSRIRTKELLGEKISEFKIVN